MRRGQCELRRRMSPNSVSQLKSSRNHDVHILCKSHKLDKNCHTKSSGTAIIELGVRPYN